MSAINNFFGDDEEGSSGSSSSSPLSVLTGPSSPLSSILQGSSSSSSSGSQSGSSPSSSFALQAVQSILGPPASTEKPLFNPGMFASQGIQNAIGSISSAASGSSTGTGSSSSSSSSSSSPSGLSGSSLQQSNSPIRNFLGGNFIQTAASMISPSFAAPPSSSASNAASSADSDDGPGFLQAASDMFDKVSNYMNSDKDITPAASTSGLTTSTAGSSSSSSPLSALVGLSNFSPFQLSSLFASSPLATAAGGSSSSSSSGTGSGSIGAGTTQRAGFFSTLKNVYELFSSSFLRRQEVGDSNECQQRLICELHQKAMNSKLFRRSLESNLMELVNIDKNLQEQIKSNPMQARVDAGTKAMLNDFLKATNNFKSGRELVNCAKMFPKCSRAKLLSTANAHLTDPANSKAIGKFSNLMKKMKFKSNQQHQSQWKLRKPSKPNGLSAPILTAQPSNQQFQATDYLQVAPLSPVPIAAGKAASGQMTPADSLKLVQQIMMMSQQQQQQQQQQAQQVSQYRQPLQYNGNSNNQQQQIYNSPQASIPAYPAASYSPYSQNNQNLYSDSLAPSMYSPATDVPYFQPADLSASLQSAQQQQQPVQQLQNQQQMQQPLMQSNQQLQPQLQNYQQYPTSTSIVPEHIASLNQQQQQQQLEKKPLQQQPQGVVAAAMAA